jgi:arsenite methyltransferase
MPDEVRRSVGLWSGCIAGALRESEYRAKLVAADFEAVDLEPTRIYRAADVRELLAGADFDLEAVVPLVDGKFMSAFVRARKPSER